MSDKKYLYLFSEGNKDMREILGGKGANLAEMTNAGMPVPQGFTISTEACTQYYNDGRQINEGIMADIYEYIGKMEEIVGKKFGDPANPLLVSVRSGARASMPGMMDTILNLGLNDEVVEGLAKKTGNPRFAYDSYRRFVQMFSDVVMEMNKSEFEKIIDEMKEAKGVTQDVELDADDMKALVAKFKSLYKEKMGADFPTDPKTQLIEAVKAVFRSWDNPRANTYRRMNEIPYDWGTAVNVQAMVFGNSGENSGTGVAFTRNPATGEKALFGEYLINAQGEDVVAGVRTPSPISKLHEEMPAVYEQFAAIADRLEKHYKDMQDMEFTIENGKLYMLQTRNGKRTAAAALKVAVDLVDEGMIDEKEAVCRVDPKQLDALLHPTFDAEALKKAQVVGKGLAASPGAACGRVVFTAEEAKEWHERGEKVILVRLETSPEDIEGMQVSQGILTVRGGMTSHAAVVARGMGTCCVSGCGDIVVDYENKKFTLAGKEYHEGDWISLDGSTGNIYGEAVATVPADPGSGYFGRLMGWADKYRQLMVYTNADTPRDAAQGRAFGAQGIGLCRTEHMFFEGERIKAMREMIVADNTEDRKKALAKIMPYQQGDFEGLYEAMEEAKTTGKLHAIGVSNMTPKIWNTFVPQFTVQPAVNQVEFNPFFQQRELRSVMAQEKTKLEAYFPLGHGSTALLTHPVVTALGEKYRKTAGQILLRFEVQEGCIVLPKSTNPQHMAENLEIFDFALTPEEMDQLHALDTGKGSHDPDAPGVAEMLLSAYDVHA